MNLYNLNQIVFIENLHNTFNITKDTNIIGLVVSNYVTHQPIEILEKILKKTYTQSTKQQVYDFITLKHLLYIQMKK